MTKSVQERASRELNGQGQLQCSDLTGLHREKQRCHKITCQLGREMMLFLPQTRARFRQTSTTHLSTAICNIVIITICHHCISPGVPHAAAEITGQKRCVQLNHAQRNSNICGRESTNRKYQAGKPKAWVGFSPARKLWERTGTES